MSSRRELVVSGRQSAIVTVVVEVYRGTVWMVSVEPPFSLEAILTPVQAERLGELLERAATEARGGTKDGKRSGNTGGAP